MRHLSRHANAFNQCGVRVDGFADVYGITDHFDGLSRLTNLVADSYFAAKQAVNRRLKPPTHTFEFLDEGGNFLKHALFLAQVLRIKRAHFG